MEYKSLADVQAVITLGKPYVVIDLFLTSYLTGLALAPFLAAETEHARLKSQPDLPDIPAILDASGNVLFPAVSPDTDRDNDITALEGEYPYLVDPGDGTTVEERRPEPVLDQAKRLELQRQFFLAAVQGLLDETAQTRGYDGILSLCSYAASQDATFAAEGQAGVAWRDGVWRVCYQVLADVENGTRPVPTWGELAADLPVIGW